MTTTVRAGGLVPTARGVFDVVDEEKKECFLLMLYALTAMNDLARVLLEGDSKRFNYSTLFFLGKRGSRVNGTFFGRCCERNTTVRR